MRTPSFVLSSDASSVWIDRYGVDDRADTLLSWLQRAEGDGLSAKAFGYNELMADLQRLRSLDFDDGNNSAQKVAARLEHGLTSACLRYCRGMRYGFVNPKRLFNNLDIEKEDTLRKAVKYRTLFDTAMDSPASSASDTILAIVRSGRLADYLQSIQPQDAFYHQLKKMYHEANTQEQRRRILVNMERCRWRRHQPIVTEGKHIIVNIAAYHLYAYGADTETGVLDMRVVCGSPKTKTPQLSSYIEWMEVNPQWVIPMSIIENEVSHHAGDSSWFAHRRYVISDKQTGNELSVRHVTPGMLLSGRYRVAQKGGEGNSLGRIIFRFKNSHSIFLHDTSNPSAFQLGSRALSHGCVRVSKPFELASYVLDSPDEWLLDRIRIAMGLPAESERGQEYESSHEDPDERQKLIGYVPVKPRVPIYIIYYTLWPDEYGALQSWPDVYGYDAIMWKELQGICL